MTTKRDDRGGKPGAGAKVNSVDKMETGLVFKGKTLNTKTVGRASTPGEVLAVCLAHNLRQSNEDHRHRRPIDPSRTPLNEVLRGSKCLAVAVELAVNILEELGMQPPRRRDIIMAIELVFQPSAGADTPEFWTECLSFVDVRYEHVVSAVVHRDQLRPHMHVLALAVANGSLSGNVMTAGVNRFFNQKRDFMAHMREKLGLRPDRKVKTKVKTLADLAVSPGRGPKTKAQADRRDAALVRQHAAESHRVEVGMGVDGHGGSASVTGNPHAHLHAHPKASTPLLRSISLPDALWLELFENRAKAPSRSGLVATD